ncbi:MAG TPA: iron-containing alcohol dehydrogenase [bacterium]|jgi:alcohol dehydrogenase class IV|nr:iron-containing alcohol dehydrogenase [bacterium]
MPTGRFSFPTAIHFGPGSRHKLADFLKGRGFQRPLLVTDRGLADLPAFTSLVDELRLADLECAVFSGVWGNPVRSQVTAGVEAFRVSNSDCMVGVGGGAALDVCKAVALMVHHPGDLFDYEDDLPGARPVDQALPFWAALPTTAGTGSEVGRSAVISDDDSHVKKIVFDPRLLAQAVFADPELTLGLSPGLTAATGMDALTHCVEAYLAKAYHPICDGIALQGLRLASRSLPRCVVTPGDLDARGDMLMASMMGALAFQKGLGVVHSCAHALSAAADLHHGLANGVMLDHALAFNAPAVPERFEALALAVGLKQGGPEAFLAWVKNLKKQIGIPAGLAAAGVAKDLGPKLAELAFRDACHPSNPRPVSQRDFEAIFAAAR